MILISHRGNLDGVNPDRENSPTYIKEAISSGFDVEIDVHWYDNEEDPLRLCVGSEDIDISKEVDWL